MLRLRVILPLFAAMWIFYGEGYSEEVEISTPALVPSPDDEDYKDDDSPSSLFSKVKIKKAMENIEQISSSAEKSFREGILPIEETEELFDEMNANFMDIIEMLGNPNNAYEFLKDKGLDRIIITNLGNSYPPLRKNILILLKTLFELAPSTTNAVMPARMIDKLLDVFETDDDLRLKTHVIDILYIWLPGNPRVQARVMKVKGLVPFYEQMTNLDLKGLHTLLSLFNMILQEHLDIRYKKTQRNMMDAEEFKIYQRIGLIEHLSRKDICNGLLDMFSSAWASSPPENDIIVPVLDLSTKIGPFCLKTFKGKPKAEEMFEAFLKYLKDENRDEYFAKFDINASSIESVLTDYVENLKQAKELKDEF